MATNNSVSGSGIPSTSSSSNTALSSTTSDVKEKDSIWYFTSEQLASSPSRRHGISTDEELAFRQKTAYLIQEMGQRLQVSQLCINTAIVYMHRFYAFHSFTHFSRNGIASASLFLAAKVEEQPRKLEYVIKASQKCLGQPQTSTSDASYLEQAQDLVFNENVLLQTLGFDVAIDHPHTHVVKTCHLVKACKDLAQTSYFLASNSLHLTSMCLQYRPTVVACFCIYLACKWSRWEIPQSTEGKHWFHYVDKSVTMDLLKQLTDEFIAIYEKSPARLKSKLNSVKAIAQGSSNRVVSKDKKSQAEDWKMGDMLKLYHSSIPTDSSSNGSGGGITMDQQVQQYQQQQQQEQQQLQQQQQLPPLGSAPQQQRRSESHSSHHRGHHSSTSHHHSKQLLPPNEIGEHKPAIHKPPYPPVSRPPRDASQPFSTAVTSHASSKQMQPPIPPPGVSSRPSSVPGRQSFSAVPQLPQRPPPQVHDPNFHKPSSRSSVVPPTQLNPPPTVPNHKIMSKPDPSSSSSSSRILHKDPNGRPIDPNKISAKMYPIPPAQNVGVDMTRNMLQQSVAPQQRPYNTQATNNSQVPPSSLHPPAYSNRTNSISNNKYDSQLSVQMQQQQQQQQQIIHQQHKNQQQQQQPVIESSFNPQLSQPSISHQYSRQQVEESFVKQPLPQQMQQCDQMELCSPPKYSQYATPQGFIPPAQQQQSSKPSSIFSPEWNEKPNSNANNGGKAGNYKTSNRDSPKKSDRSTPKKEKNRSLTASSAASSLPSMIDVNTAMGARQTQNPTPIFGIGKQQQKQQDQAVIPPTYGTGYGVVKRSSSSMEHQIKLEEELMRESKIRKLDLHPVSSPQPATTTSSIKTAFTGTVNGIETNPDLVSSLLKESLCTENKFSSSGFMKTEPSTIIKSDYQDPMLLYGSIMTTLPDQILQNAPAAVKEEQVVSAVMETEDYSDSLKSEKKKKKEKHKHKEKDKSKDKEERKKHKKDKDRHKDKERASEASESSEPVKIKISKDKLNLSASADSANSGAPVIGFKIKIPKDRITGDLNSGVGGGPHYDGSNTTAAHPLKIKISKDKIENYSSGNVDQQSSVNSLGSGTYQYHGNNVGGSSSSTSSKKKDRDRDKEKRSSSHDYNKINGSSNGGNNNPVGSSFSLSTATARDASTVSNSMNSSVPPKGQISNKIQQYNTSNMSHLFGESNDDDDDDDDDDDSDDDIGTSPKLPPTFSSSSSHHKSTLSSHGSSRYNSSDNRYSSSGTNNVQQQFSNHRRQSSSSYQKSSW